MSALLVVGLRLQCLGSCKGLCMSLAGRKDPLMEATPCLVVRGVPNVIHSRRALCRANVCPRVINWAGREWGGMLPRIKCSVVNTANVPEDHRDRGRPVGSHS